MLQNIHNSDQVRSRLEADTLAPLPDLLQHRVFRVIALTTLHAGQIQIQHPPVRQDADIVISQRQNEPESPLHGELPAVP